MAEISINVDFAYIFNHARLVSVLEPGFRASNEDVVNVVLNLNTTYILYSDFLLMVVSAVEAFKEQGAAVNIDYYQFGRKVNRFNYASRVNFFKLIGTQYPEQFVRHDARGRFTEIKQFDSANIGDLHKEIMRILIENGVNEDMLVVLDFCLYEVLDNTLNHSGPNFEYGAGKGFVCAQYFPNWDRVRIMIADTGIGIHQALTTHPNSDYKDFSESEAVLHCIDKGVTNSRGRGFGLWATSKMVKENGGTLLVHSGNHQLRCVNNKTVHETNMWKGTYTFLQINTNIPVDHKVIFGEDSQQAVTFEEFKQELFGVSDELW